MTLTQSTKKRLEGSNGFSLPQKVGARKNRRRLKQLFSRSPTGLGDPLSRIVLRAHEQYVATAQAWSEGIWRITGYRFPPPKLRVLLVGHADAANFLDTGAP